jgi:cystathionine beta-lyase/cystathionine gamma-synthase
MSTHRNPRPSVTNDPQNSNFDAGTALEHLRAEFIDIEALTRAAEAAADSLPAPSNARQRLVFGRIQSLTTKASEQASASLRFANAQVFALAAQMEVRRKAAAH